VIMSESVTLLVNLYAEAKAVKSRAALSASTSVLISSRDIISEGRL
jgi:hypothetical protein